MIDHKTEMIEFLKNENDYITYLLEAFEVPETVESKFTLFKHRLFLIISEFQMIPMKTAIWLKSQRKS